jgi:cobalt-zinc-cadmium efflux system protein
MNMHTHSHSAGTTYGRAFLIGILLNSGFIVAEIMYGLQADSMALLADAGHNASDVLALCIAWSAVWLARRQASERFTYGMQGASIIAALVNALLLLVAVGGIGLEAMRRLSEPLTPSPPTIIAVATLGVLINGLTAWLFGRESHDLNIRGAYLHMAADAAISLGVALSGVVMIYTGAAWLDPAASLVIVALIVLGTWPLLMDSVGLALHAVPRHIDAQAVRQHLAILPGVAEVHDLHIWAMSTSEVSMSVHLVMPGGHPGDGFIASLSEAMETQFHIHHATFQIEVGDGGSDGHLHCAHA